MQFLVFSDSHGERRYLTAALRRNPDIKNVIFLGDGLADIKALRESHPHLHIRAVRGNCDGIALDYPSEDTFTLFGTTVFLCHGHTLSVKGGADAAIYRAREVGAHVLLFGHTHEKAATYLSDLSLHICNPGSIGRPYTGDPTFAILDILPDGSVSISHGSVSRFS
jgi:putative phosphoesterase